MVKFGLLILRKIIKIVTTRCQILRLKCTKIHFGWGSAPAPAGGAYSASPDPLAKIIKGDLLLSERDSASMRMEENHGKAGEGQKLGGGYMLT